MSRFIGVVFLYVAMLLGWTGVGLMMLFAPARFGNLLNDNLMLFPQVKQGDWGKKLILRCLGIGFLAFAVRFAVELVYETN